MIVDIKFKWKQSEDSKPHKIGQTVRVGRFYVGNSIVNHSFYCQAEPEVGGVAVPVGGTPDRGQGAPRSLASNKRLEEGVRPAQLIPRTQAKQVRWPKILTRSW